MHVCACPYMYMLYVFVCVTVVHHIYVVSISSNLIFTNQCLGGFVMNQYLGLFRYNHEPLYCALAVSW